MKLAEISTTPKLVKIQLNDDDVVDTYGEPIDFWILDRQPMGTFMKLATLDEKNVSELAESILQICLDENGKPMLKDGATPPASIMMKVIGRVVEELGNLENLTTA